MMKNEDIEKADLPRMSDKGKGAQDKQEKRRRLISILCDSRQIWI